MSASVAVAFVRKLSAVNVTTASFTLSLRRRYSCSRSLSATASQSVTEDRSFSTSRPRRTLSSKSAGISGASAQEVGNVEEDERHAHEAEAPLEPVAVLAHPIEHGHRGTLKP